MSNTSLSDFLVNTIRQLLFQLVPNIKELEYVNIPLIEYMVKRIGPIKKRSIETKKEIETKFRNEILFLKGNVKACKELLATIMMKNYNLKNREDFMLFLDSVGNELGFDFFAKSKQDLARAIVGLYWDFLKPRIKFIPKAFNEESARKILANPSNESIKRVFMHLFKGKEGIGLDGFCLAVDCFYTINNVEPFVLMKDETLRKSPLPYLGIQFPQMIPIICYYHLYGFPRNCTIQDMMEHFRAFSITVTDIVNSEQSFLDSLSAVHQLVGDSVDSYNSQESNIGQSGTSCQKYETSQLPQGEENLKKEECAQQCLTTMDSKNQVETEFFGNHKDQIQIRALEDLLCKLQETSISYRKENATLKQELLESSSNHKDEIAKLQEELNDYRKENAILKQGLQDSSSNHRKCDCEQHL